jgi:hypothetical protein
MSEKIKVRKLIKQVSRILRANQDNIHELMGVNDAINNLWQSVKDRIEPEEVTQAECEEMVGLLERYHGLSAAIHAGGLAAHVQMENVRPRNINEGDKCPPWEC